MTTYVQQTWTDGAAGGTPLSAARLNHMEAGITFASQLAVNVRAFGATGDGVTDDTAAVQAALDAGPGDVVVPAGTYRCAALALPSGVTLRATGPVRIVHIPTGGFVGNFPRAMLTGKTQPAYKAPGAAGRVVPAMGVTDVAVVGPFTFDAAGAAVIGLQLVAAARVLIDGITVTGGVGGLDLRAVQDGLFRRVMVDGITDDGISITDQNFAGRSITTRLTFDHCTVRNSCTNNTGAGSGKNAYELDDGPTYIDFIGCQAVDNFGNGFQMHVHTTEFDLHSVRFIGCTAANNTALPGNPDSVIGFGIGQCPDGSLLGRISYTDCISTGSQLAFARLPGAETGIVSDVTISGGYWSTPQAPAGRDPLKATILYVGKDFSRFRVENATLAGAVDGHGVYTYATGGQLALVNVTIADAYIPLYLSHTGGTAVLSSVKATPKPWVSAVSSTCIYLTVDTLLADNLELVADSGQYSAGPVRLIGVDYARVAALVRNTAATIGGNGITLQDCGLVALSGSVVTRFANGVFFAGTLSSVSVTGTVFKGCTAKYNTVPAELVEAGNAV